MRLTEQHDQLAPRPGYVYRFDSTIPHQRYYFVSELGYGVQSHAQLVQDRETGLKAVQKVDRKLCLSTLEHEEPAEIRILRRLISSHRLADYQPRWITLLNYEQVLAYQETERAGTHLSYQVSYWKFCNGGTLYSLVNPYIPDFIAEKDWLAQGQYSPAPQRHLPQLPISLVARAIRHICETLEVMYQGGNEAVYHCDLHASNIFLHWTKEDPLPGFCIGDFGMARTASQSLLDSEKFSHKCGIPFDKQLKEPGPPGIVPEGYRRRWDLAMFHECNLNNFFRFMVVSATPTIKDACPRSIRLPVSRPQPQRSRDVVKQIAQQMNQPTPKHRHRPKANAATAGAGLCNEQPSTSSRSWWGFGPNSERTTSTIVNDNVKLIHGCRLLELENMIETLNELDQVNAVLQPHMRPPSLSRIIEAAGDLEKEALQWEQHTRNFKEFVKEKKRKALFQEFETAPFVFRRDGPEAKEILRKALKLPQRHPYRVYHGGNVDEPESLEEVWGRENVAGPWRVVEVRV
ncbi:hypothetical protein QBC32DRAFT_214280 [Pseudoneurospora amorphoporcata]|uniref:Protein kinase domain-containing protein n=1 Tax=Pseudoneurospora amorphoporcata TaxID=241081 RepID=A0AAN6NTU1_9PEZI|nr:hypothetical protein QBC32DRAFT_214280 [Pseudoneurospora amorphoporcata]